MADTSKIVSHMVVVDSNGQRVGTVDKIENFAVKLAHFDQPDHEHHWIPFDWIAEVDQLVRLDRDADAVRRGWASESRPAGARGGI